MSIFRRRLMMGEKNEEEIILPEGYTRVEFIETDGDPYINTNIKGTGTWVIDAQVNNQLSRSQILIGKTYDRGHWAGVVPNGKWGVNSSVYTSYDATMRTKMRIIFTLRKATIVIGAESASITGGYDSNDYFWIFSCLQHGSFTIGAKLWRATCVQDDIKVFDGIPSLDSNGKAGLFDLVSNTFKGNVGKGDFTYGQII